MECQEKEDMKKKNRYRLYSRIHIKRKTKFMWKMKSKVGFETE